MTFEGFFVEEKIDPRYEALVAQFDAGEITEQQFEDSVWNVANTKD